MNTSTTNTHAHIYLFVSLFVRKSSKRCLSNASCKLTLAISSSRFTLSPGEMVEGVDTPECEPLFSSAVRIGTGVDSVRVHFG